MQVPVGGAVRRFIPWLWYASQLGLHTYQALTCQYDPARTWVLVQITRKAKQQKVRAAATAAGSGHQRKLDGGEDHLKNGYRQNAIESAAALHHPTFLNLVSMVLASLWRLTCSMVRCR